MKFQLCMVAVMLAAIPVASAQVSSHAPAMQKPAAPAASAVSAPAPTGKAAARVNGAVLTDIDVVREMYAIFPYASQHNGFPKGLEADIRKGATDMVIFEELVYQEAKRRSLTVAPEKMTKAMTAFRKQFPDEAAYQQYIRIEGKGDKAVVREKVRRSLLIEQMLKMEVTEKSAVTLAQAKAFYDKNSKLFEHGETVAIQTISIIPPETANAAVKAESKVKIKDIARLGREAKTSRDFGLLAEQLSDDDWRTKLGNRGTVNIANLPPEVVKVARAMKPGTISDPIQLDRAWVVVRLNAHTPAGKTPFTEAKAKLISDLRKQKTNEIRAALNQKLRKDAKVEVL